MKTLSKPWSKMTPHEICEEVGIKNTSIDLTDSELSSLLSRILVKRMLLGLAFTVITRIVFNQLLFRWLSRIETKSKESM